MLLLQHNAFATQSQSSMLQIELYPSLLIEYEQGGLEVERLHTRVEQGGYDSSRGDVEKFHGSIGASHQDNIITSRKHNRNREVLKNVIIDCSDEFTIHKVIDIEPVKQIECDKVFLSWRYCQVSANSNFL